MRRTGRRLPANGWRPGLSALPGVVDVRGMGLLLAAELAPELDAAAGGRRRAVGRAGRQPVTPTAVRLAPPLIVTDDEIDEAVTILKEVLS